VVLDIPKEAIGVFYGVLLAGRGTVWINDLRVEEVDRKVHTTGR